jgi:phosphate uptake regulator
MITLPKDWANSVGLKKNDTVGLQAQPDGSLTLYPKGTAPSPKRSTKVIDATDIKDRGLLYRQLVAAYIAGHSSILIKSEQPLSSTITSAVTSFVQTSIGIETLEADETHILVADLIEHEVIDLKRTIERMKLLIRGMIRDLFDASFAGNLDNIKDMKSRDTEIDRIYWLASRHCNIYQKDYAMSNKMGMSMSDMTASLSLCRVLEDIGDQVNTISKYLMMIAARDGGFETNKDAGRIGDKVINLFTNAMKSWADKDLALAEQTISEINTVIGDVNQSNKTNITTDYAPAYPIGVILVGSKMLLENCKIIAEYALNLAME